VSLSNPAVAALISSRFEPAWQSVRDAPQVTIDFGGGRILRRTLHGNIATFICAPDGTTLDVVPGLYDAATYTTRLTDALALAAAYAKWPEDARPQLLRKHHASAASQPAPDAGALRLLSKSRAELPTENVIGDRPQQAGSPIEARSSKTTIEIPTEHALGSSQSKRRAEAPVERIVVAPDGTRVNLNFLARDTVHNETVRRPLISAILAEAGRHTPESLTRRIYREVLHADLDDPYLGLGETLFGAYPFAR